ncbi:hypothetical protein C8Q76DRAFT_28357 [Earliella scabrosa]|nr:hypothetical protein C8Q76DRAFT_28357 [Earliella scabrosa]
MQHRRIVRSVGITIRRLWTISPHVEPGDTRSQTRKSCLPQATSAFTIDVKHCGVRACSHPHAIGGALASHLDSPVDISLCGRFGSGRVEVITKVSSVPFASFYLQSAKYRQCPSRSTATTCASMGPSADFAASTICKTVKSPFLCCAYRGHH